MLISELRVWGWVLGFKVQSVGGGGGGYMKVVAQGSGV